MNAALRYFETTEANLIKIEKVLSDIRFSIPDGIQFGSTPDYEDNCRSFESLLEALPKIDGWKPEITPMGLNEIAQNRLDAKEIGEIECEVSVEHQIDEPDRLIREYRYRFNKKRREMIRDSLMSLIDAIDTNLRDLSKLIKDHPRPNEKFQAPPFEELKINIAQINTLLGSSVLKPARWTDLARHIHFATARDLHDIIDIDWPSVKAGLRKSLYGEKEPAPVGVGDLSDIVNKKPSGPVATKLRWDQLTPEDFERLLFVLISSEKAYENPEWLMRTNAPDRGRDLSVYRVDTDPLRGTVRQRIIIQCRHWLTKSVGPSEVATLRELMKTWEPPRIDVHVIATSGRFTSDAVAIIERHNQSDSALRIEMWPESHLERLLASRPALIAQFALR